MSKVTIAIPVYNEEKYLASTISSALGQDYQDITVVITDNASTDRSLEIAQEFAKKDPRVVVVAHEKNIGMVGNFKASLEIAKTPYFCWLGAHDLYTQDFISVAVAHFENHADTSLVYPEKSTFIDVKGEYLDYGFSACSQLDTFHISDPLARGTMIIRKIGPCTNLNGLIRTEVARKMPFVNVKGGTDVLMMVVGSFYGHFRSIPIEGIQRRIVRHQNTEEKALRLESHGIVMPEDKCVGIFFKHAFKCGRIGVGSWLKYGVSFKDALEFKFGTFSPQMLYINSIRNKSILLQIIGIVLSFIKRPGALFHRPTLGLLKKILMGQKIRS